MAFLRAHGKRVKVHWWQWHWEILHVSRGGVLSSLAAFVADHAITNLAVWFTVWGSSGVCLLEMEGGNNYIWLAKEFEDDARVRLVEAAGGAIWPTDL